ILNRATETDELAAIADKVAVPTYTLDLVQWLRPFLAPLRLGGLLHLCNNGACTWQEYGQFAIDCAAAGKVPLKGRKVAPLKMADLKAFVARRPPYTAMSTGRFTQLTGLHPRPWQEAVESYAGQYWAPAWRARAAA
nr:sugar nucleotide-binding protein [Verrucomicrobiota bacterium]